MHIFHNFFKNEFNRHASILTIGTAISQAVAILATPILSRIYTPTQYGVLALYMSVVSVVAILVTLRYEVRILLPPKDVEGRNVLTVALILTLLLGGVLFIASFVRHEKLLNVIGLTSIDGWSRLALIAGVLTATFTIFSNWFNRQGRYVLLAVLRPAQSILVVMFGILFGLLGVFDGLLYAQFLALLSLVIIYCYFGKSSVSFGISREEIKWTIGEHRRAPFYLLPTALLDVFTLQLPYILISVWFSEDLTGQYRMAYSLLALPGGLIGGALAQVFFQKFANVWPDAVNAKALLLNMWKTLSLIGLFPLFIVLFFGDDLFSWVLGERWRTSGELAVILAPMVFISFIHSPTSTSLLVMKKDKNILFFGISVLVYRPLALYCGYQMGSLKIGLVLFVVLEIMQMLVFQYLAISTLNKVIQQTQKA